jgi:plasmid stabilization system protein ParE
MKRLFYSELAIADLKGILDYIAQDKPEAARAFVDAIIERCHLLAANLVQLPKKKTSGTDFTATPKRCARPRVGIDASLRDMPALSTRPIALAQLRPLFVQGYRLRH